MSTYKPISNSSPKKKNNTKDKAIKDLRKWLNTQLWFNANFDICVKGMNEKEITVLIQSVDFEQINKDLKNTNFQKSGINISYKSFEKASWDMTTYFIDFNFLG